MKIYYLISTELGWDNLICLATTPQKLIEYYTDGEVVLETEKEVKDFIKNSNALYMSYKFLNE
jgi:hypothetical protein